jgi:hypothetical protein
MSKNAAFLERLRVADRVRKLLAIADKHPDSHEGKSAREKAGQLIAKHHLDSESLRPKHKVSQTYDHTKAVMGAMMAAFPGKDTEDYSKYDPETGKRRE